MEIGISSTMLLLEWGKGSACTILFLFRGVLAECTEMERDWIILLTLNMADVFMA